jgi:hypothetical protein|tara:strand:- start:100 stop:378 length:279 start_codon:yes stop_codon:yes gene_type:complete
MQHSTAHTFKVQQSCSVKLYTSSYHDAAEINIRDTETANKVSLEGLSIAALQGGIIDYVNTLGYRKEDEEAAKFLRKLSAELTKALPQEVAQ